MFSDGQRITNDLISYISESYIFWYIITVNIPEYIKRVLIAINIINAKFDKQFDQQNWSIKSHTV